MRLIVLCLALALSITSSAQQDWIAQHGPYGGEIKDVEYDAASGWTYAIIGSDLHYSEDLGVTWTVASSLTFPSGVDIEISNGTVYFLQGFDVYTSPAGQDNFTDITTDFVLNAQKLKVMPNGTTLVAIQSASQIYYSTNGGVTWAIGASMSASFNPDFLEVTADGKVLVVNTSNNTVLFTSTPTTSSNSFAVFGSALPNVHSIATNNDGSTVYAVTSSSLHQLSAAGGTWSSIKGGNITAGTVSNTAQPSFLEFSADGVDMYFLDNNNHALHHKTVAGASTTWVKNTNGFPGAGRIIKRASAIDGTQIFLGSYTDLFLTSGTTYSQKNGTITGVNPQTLGAYGNELIMHAGQSFSYAPLYRSFDEGNTWEGEPEIPGSIAAFSYNKDFATNPDGNAAFALVHLSDGTHSDLYRKVGTHWTVVGTAPELLWVDLTEDQQAVGFGFGTDNVLSYSSDVGTGWSTITISGLPNPYQIDPEKTMMASPTRMLTYVMDLNTATSEWYRIDINPVGGFASATALTGNLPFASFDKAIAKNGNFYLFDDSTNPDRYSISFDGGVSWNNKTVPYTGGSTQFLVADNGYIFIINRFVADMYMSRDNGTSVVPTDLIDLSVSQYVTDVLLDHEGYAILALDQHVVYKSREVVVIPLTPTSLTANAITKNTISLEWVDNSYNEEYYTIERSTDGTNFTQVGKVSGDALCEATVSRGFLMDMNLDPDTEYTYRITAVNDAGSSVQLIDAFTTLPDCSDGTLPDARSWFAANAGGNGYAATTMNNVGIRHISGNVYEVENITMGLVGFSTIVGKFTLDCDQTVIIEDQTGQIKPNGQGTWDPGTSTLTLKWMECGEDSFETITFSSPGGGAPPTTPVVQALVKSDTEVEISWSTGFNQKDFVVERATAGAAGPYSQIGGSSVVPYPGDSFVDSGPFVVGNQYFYRVTARNVIIPTPLTAEGLADVVFAKPNFIVSATEVTNLVTFSYNTVWADFDADGRDDLLTLNINGATPEYIFFRNLGNGDFNKEFIDLQDKVYLYISAVDFNNDNKLDLAVAEADGTEVELYQGNGDLTFTKLSTALVGDLATDIEGEITSISWSDVNRDGRLDALVTTEHPDNSIVYPPQLFLRTSGGPYNKVTGSGFESHDTDANFAVWADYDTDGFVDVLIVDGTLCKLYRNNNADGTFTVQPSSGIVDAGAIAAWGDYNADGQPDLYIGTLSNMVLYRNNANGTFTQDVSTTISTEGNYTTAPLWADVNNDGLQDLISPGVIAGFGAGKIFINTSSGGTTSFDAVSTEMISDTRTGAFGGAIADYNKDGFVDLALPRAFISFTGFYPSNFTLYKNNNTISPARNWIEVRLKGTGPTTNKGAIGAQVYVQTANKNEFRDVQVLTGPRSQNSSNLHFGIGNETSINSITVYWPRGGAAQVYNNPPINQAITIEEDANAPVVTLLSPADASPGGSVSTTVEITFDEPTIAAPGKNIYITRVSDATIVGTKAVTLGVKTLNKYTFTFSGQLDSSTEYEVSFDANAFADLYGNVFAGLGNAWTFTTLDAPVMTATEPTNGASAAAPNTTLSVTFDLPTTAKASKQLKVYLSSDLVTAVHTVAATSSVPSGNKHTFTLPSPLLSNTDYTVKLDAGSFNSTTAGLTPYVEWSFKTALGPQVTATLPADAATGIALAANMEVTFGVVTTPVTGKELHIYKASAPSTEISAVDASDAVPSGMTQIFDLPSNLEAGTTYNAELDAGAFLDATQGTSQAKTWSFATVPVPTVASSVPTSGATGVAPNTKISITFNLPTTPVLGKKLFVYPGPVLTGPVEEIDVTNVVTNGNEHTYTLSGDLFTDHDFTALFEEGAFVSATNGPTPLVQWAFSTSVGPALSVVKPLGGATGVAPNTELWVELDAAVTPAVGKKFSVFLASDLLNAVHSINVTGATFEDDIYKFTLPAPLLTSTGYVVVIDDDAFVDDLGGKSSSLTWGFTTAPGPAPISKVPAADAFNIAPNTNIVLTFAVPTTAVPGKQLNVYLTSDLDTPVHTLNVNLSGATAVEHTYTLPPYLETFAGYTIKVDAGAFVDNQEGTSLAIEWDFTTVQGPAPTAKFPAEGEPNAAPNTAIGVTFAVPTTAVVGKQLKVFKASSNTLVHTLNAIQSAGTTEDHSYTLPANLETFTAYTVKVDAGSFINNVGATSPLFEWNFTTAPGPEIVSTVPSNTATGVAPNTSIKVSFGSVLTTAVPGKHLNVYKTSSQGMAVHTLNATASSGTVPLHTYTLPAPLDMLTSYTVKLDEGSFVDNQEGPSAYKEWEFTTAGGPAAPSVFPADEAIDVAPNTKLKVTFAEPTTGVPGKTLKVYFLSDPDNAKFVVNADAVLPDNNQYVYTLSGNLDTAQPYKVVADVGAYADVNGGTSPSFDWNFVTEPAITNPTLTPTNGQVNVAPNTKIAVDFGFATTRNVGQVKVFRLPDETTPEYTVDVTSAVPNGTKHVFTLSGDLGTDAQYKVKIGSGAFMNDGGAGSAALSWSFSTKQGPDAATFTPGDGATDVATNADIGLNFSVATTPVAGKEINIYRSSDTGTPIRTLNATDAFNSGNKRLFTINPPLPTKTLITVIADAGAFMDVTNAVSSVEQWEFETMDGPKVVLLSPLDEATDIAANTKLEITYNQNVTAKAGKMIRLFKQGDVNPVWETLVTSVPPVGSKFTFTVTPKLQGETNYTVLVEAGAFEDVIGNLSDAVGATQWNFVTDNGPAASGFVPANNAPNVSTVAAIEITFDRVLSSAVSGKLIHVFDGGAAVAELDVSTNGTVGGSKYTLNAPVAQWPAGKQLTITLDAGAFVDIGDNESAAITSGSYKFSTEVGPLITARSPGVGTTDIPPNAPLVLTFDKDITAVAGKNIKVMNGAAAVLNSNVLTTGIEGRVYTHAAPAGGWPLNKTLTVLLDAGAFADATLKPSQAITGTQWTFTTINVTDEEAPVITFTAQATVPNSSKPTILQAVVQDNVGVATTSLFIRAIGGSSFVEVAPSAAPVAGTYTYSVPAGKFDETGAQYYFTAKDGSNNTARKPVNENEYFTTYVAYDGESAIPSGFVGEGKLKASWRVMSVPFDLGNNNAVGDVFSELATGDPAPVYKKDWRMLALKPFPTDWIDYNSGFTEIERGKGYMITMKTRRQLTVGANLTAPNNTRSNLFSLDLKKGWNLIGNPYLSQIDWDDVAAFNSLDGSALVFKKFNGGVYTDNSLIEAYSGGFVQVGADMTVLVPFFGQTEADGGRTKDIVFEDGDWVMQIKLRQDSLENTFGGVGMHHMSGPAFDALDNFNGPRFIDFIEMNFEHPQDFPKLFSCDVIANQDEYTWEFNVEGNGEGLAEMSWDSGVVLPAGKELFLWDEGAQMAINMGEENSYEFDPHHSHKFRIYFGKDARKRIAPDRSLLGNPSPNPTTGISYIPFSLPEGNAQYGVRIEVFDGMGRKLGTIIDGSYGPGIYSAGWVATESSSNGLYSVRMTVVTGDLQEVYSAKILLNK